VESSTGSTSTLNNPAATADKIAALALQARMTSVGSPPVGLNSTTSSSGIPVPVSKLGKVTNNSLIEPTQRKSPIKQQQLVSQSSAVNMPAHSAATSVANRVSDQPYYANEESFAKQPTQQLPPQQQQQVHEQQKLQQQQELQQVQMQQQSSMFRQQQQQQTGAMNGAKADNLPPLLFPSQPELSALNSNSNIKTSVSNNNWSKFHSAHWRIAR
jgi:hypothetical protein